MRRKVNTLLPKELRAELDRRLIDSGFGNYRGLSAWLAEQGYHIGKTALHRYGQEMEEKFERTMEDVRRTQALAAAYADTSPDEREALTEATVRIAQDSLLHIALSMRDSSDDPSSVARTMPYVSRALADLGRLAISRARWTDEQRRTAAEAARASAKAAGLDEATAEKVASGIKIYLPENGRGTR